MPHPTDQPRSTPGTAPGTTPDAPSRQAAIDHLLALDPDHATAADILTGPAAALVTAEARTWIENCHWADLTADQVPDLPGHEVLHGITAHWGTLSGLIEDLQTYARRDPDQLDHHLTAHPDPATAQTGPEAAATAVGAQVPAPGSPGPRPGDVVRLHYDDFTTATGVWVIDETGRPGVADDGGIRDPDVAARLDVLPTPGPDNASIETAAADTRASGTAGLARHPAADDPDYQPHPQELSDAYDRGDGPPGLTYSQYVAWQTGPGLPAEVLDAAAAEHDQTQAALDRWDAHADVLADLAAPARNRHPDATAQMDDEQAATWHAHHDPAGVPALVHPAHLHTAIDHALTPDHAPHHDLDLADGFELDA